MLACLLACLFACQPASLVGCLLGRLDAGLLGSCAWSSSGHRWFSCLSRVSHLYHQGLYHTILYTMDLALSSYQDDLHKWLIQLCFSTRPRHATPHHTIPLRPAVLFHILFSTQSGPIPPIHTTTTSCSSYLIRFALKFYSACTADGKC